MKITQQIQAKCGLFLHPTTYDSEEQGEEKGV